MFESPEQTIKRIQNETHVDTRYDDVELNKIHYIDLSDDSFAEENIARLLPLAAAELGITVEPVVNAKTALRQWPTWRFTGNRDVIISFLKERAHPHRKSLFHEKK